MGLELDDLEGPFKPNHSMILYAPFRLLNAIPLNKT